MIEYKFPYESFIGGWYISNSVCDDMIKVFHSSKLKKETIKGLQGKNGVADINLNIKDSEDLIISHLDNDKEILNYREQLQLCLNEYVKKYPDANTLAKYNINSDYNIQYYSIGGGYKSWHSERSAKNESIRVLVFMTYLNDVEDGGTMFKYQKLISPAKKGLTLIWPSDWTHTHKGQISKTKEKYIVTGWFNYI
jgi:prolyl 4-hydroxylase